jgi:hypothetical protein
MKARRDIVWERLDRPGLEHLVLDSAAGRHTGQSAVVLALDGKTARLRYSIDCDGRWRTRRASFAVEYDGQRRLLELERDDDGAWSVDGARRPDLDQCFEIDFAATPFTNTMPIRQFELRHGESRVQRALYITVPDLQVRIDEQEYTRLDAANPPRRFRYRGLSTGFTAEVEVDEDGIVTSYPPGWRRR